MDITYCGHSGFSVRTEHRLLIFDYLGNHQLERDVTRPALAFISHAHSDHCWQGMFDWARAGQVSLFVGNDVNTEVGTVMKPGDIVESGDGARIEAYGSTDAGVSFLVSADGFHIFHAGDFNFWHWRAESTRQEVDEAEAAFEGVLQALRGKAVDVAFFPVDPRMGDGCEEGALRYVQAIRPRLLIPMHFWNRPEAAVAFGNLPMPEGVQVCSLTHAGECIHWNMETGRI